MASRLTSPSSITICGENIPPPQLFQNIPMLHCILEQVVEDWLRAVEPYQRQIDNAETDSATLTAVLSGFEELQPSLLKCLFSYSFFFVAAVNAYRHFYRELNRANNLSGLRQKHRKPPKESSSIRKIRTIRDIAIAHFPSEKAIPIDAFAAMSWQPMALSWSRGRRPDLEKLTFGPGHLRGRDSLGRSIQSQDLEVLGVKTAHYGHCLPYLEHYDEVCVGYLNTIQAALS